VKTEDNPSWYLSRIRGRDPLVAIHVLDSAMNSGSANKEIENKYLQSCTKAAEKLISDDLPARAAETCRRALLIKPDSTDLATLLKKAEAAEHRAAAEVKSLQAELAAHPDNDYARFTLGDTFRKLGRIDDAFAEYTRIIQGKAPFDGGKERIEELRRFISANLKMDDPAAQPPQPANLPADAQTASAPGFQLSFYDPELGKRLLKEAPAIRDRVAAALECKPAGDCKLSVLRTRGDFIAATGNKFGDGYSSADSVWTYHGATGILDNVIPHELAHVLLARAFGNLPAWLDEGLAVRQETAAGTYWQLLRDTKALSVRELLAWRGASSKEENSRFYASAYGFVDMLAEDGGIKKIHRLIAALKTQTPEAAFREVYGTRSLQELEERWVKHLQN